MSRTLHSTLAALVIASGMASSALATCPGGRCTPPAPSRPASELTVRDDSPSGKAEELSRKANHQALEKELKKLRYEHFRSTKNAKVRQLGFDKLKTYADPAAFPSLVAVFGDEDADVQQALVSHFADLKTVEGDTALSRCAVFGASPKLRPLAIEKLAERYDHGKTAVPFVVQQAAADGLRSKSEGAVASAATLCNALNLIDAIPMLIQAQAPSTSAAGYSNPPNGDAMPAIATILIGQQQAYVSDLEPVVGDSAVGFNPTVSVLNTGTILSIKGAAVTTYRTEVYYALNNLATRNWNNQSVAHLGYDRAAWNDWYTNEFQPHVAAKKAAAAKLP